MLKIALRRVHTSWLIMTGAIGVLIGAVAAKYMFSGYDMTMGWIVIALVVALYGLWRQRLWCLALLFIAGGIAGYNRASHVAFAQKIATQYHHKTVEVTGVVYEDVTQSNGSTSMTLKDFTIDGRAFPGKVWVSIIGGTHAGMLRSDSVTVRGELKPGFATFVGSMSYAKLVSVRHIAHSDIAREVRDWFAAGAMKVLPHPEVDLGLGFVVGEKRSLPDELLDALKVVGLTHVIVASGYNLTILVRLSRRLLAKYSKFGALAGSAVLVFSFVLVTGVSPSMSRAAIVTGLSLLAWYYGRNVHPMILLFVAAAVTVLIDPTYAWGDAGWLLSFTAFAGVLVAAPLINRYFFDDEKPGVIRQILIETTSAQLLTMPVIMCLFGKFSLIALLANLLVLPLVPLAMLLLFISGILALAGMPFVTLVSVPAYWLLHYMVWVVEQLSSVSWASIDVAVSVSVAVALYGVMIAAIFYMRRATKFSLNTANVVE